MEQGPVYVHAFTVDATFDREKLVEWLKASAKRWIFQTELAASGYKHYQGYVSLVDKQRPVCCATRLRELCDFKGSVHFSHASKVGQEALKKYSMKVDTRVDGPWCDRDSSKVVEYEKKIERVRLEDVFDPSSVSLTHASIIGFCMDPTPVHRMITCIVDGPGAFGKSDIVRYLLKAHPSVCYLSYGTAKGLMHLAAKNPSALYIIDLPRSRPTSLGQGELWNAIEQIKNGFLMSERYEGSFECIKPPKVVVFTNVAPPLHFLSKDRWDLVDVSSEPRPPPRVADRLFSSFKKQVIESLVEPEKVEMKE